MYDLVIRNGKIYDGTGAPAFDGDVAIEGDRIVAVGTPDDGQIGAETETIDAAGRIVTPGFVDAHTHYDGQITWDPFVSPSTYHGVTTIVTGNCGVGFAPCHADQRDWLIGLMEGVEDIPGTALHAGIHWDWETFPEYLDALEKTPLAIDVGTQVPHGAAAVMNALGLTAFAFIGLSGYALVTKKDFSFMTGFINVGMWIMLGAIILGLIFDLGALRLAISAGIVLLMSALILWQTSAIVHGGETNYIRATVTLFMSIYNLFMSLLHLFMAFGGGDD